MANKKYGGVNNSKRLNEIQEGRIVSAPGMAKIVKKKCIGSIILGWAMFLIVSYILTDLLLIIATDAWGNVKAPLWVIIVLPTMPFLLVLLFKIITREKHANPKD